MTLSDLTVTAKRQPNRLAVLVLLLLTIVSPVVGWLWWKSRGVRVHAVIRVSRPEIAEGELGRLDWPIRKKTQAGLIKSPMVINAALRQPGISQLPELVGLSDPIRSVQDRLEVVMDDDSELLVVSLEGRDPDSAIKLLDAVINAYMREEVDAEKLAELNKLDRLKKTLSQASSEFKEELNRIGAIERMNGDNGAAKRAELELASLTRQQSRVEDLLLEIEMQIASAAVPTSPSQPLDGLRAQRELLLQKLEQVKKAIGEQIEIGGTSPDVSVDLQILRSDVRRRERYLEELWMEIEKAQGRIDEKPQIKVLQTATVDDDPSNGE